MKTLKTVMQPTLLVLALAAAFPAAAQSNEDLAKELRALRARVTELEQQVQAGPGMTADQQAEFNRIATKTEAIQDGMSDKGLAGLKISGYIEPVFVYNKLQDRAGFQFLNQSPYGYSYDTSYMGAAVLDLLKETESGTLWHLTLAPNRSAGMVVDGASIVQEATVSVPLDGQTRLLAGQMPDWSGYEYQQPTLNPFTSHNLLFDFTLPTAYTGAGLEMKEGKWWIRTMLANVNATMRQSREKSPSWAFRADYAKGEFSGWGFASLIGKAPRFQGDDAEQKAALAVLMEVDGWFTRGDWTLGGQLSYGQQKKAAIALDANGNRQDARWAGLSGMVGYNLTPRWQLLARADYLKNDQNGGGLFTYNYADGINGLGAGNGASDDPQRGANRYALTFGTKYLFNTSTTLKAEYRLDGADRAVFEDVKNGGYRKVNQMFATSMVVAF
jgi:hypothetical protein